MMCDHNTLFTFCLYVKRGVMDGKIKRSLSTAQTGFWSLGKDSFIVLRCFCIDETKSLLLLLLLPCFGQRHCF